MKQQFRLATTGTIRLNAFVDNRQIIPSDSVTIVLYKSGGDTLQASASASRNATTGEMTYALTTTHTAALDLNYKAVWSFATGGVTYYEEQLFDVVRSVLSIPITDDDLYDELESLREVAIQANGTATAGAAGTLTDTGRKEADDYWDWLEEKLGPLAHERGHGCDCNGWLARPWHLEEKYHPTVWTTDVALEQIEKKDPTKPFFIWISHLRPHSPYDPPRFFWNMYINRKLPEIPVGNWASKYNVPNPGIERESWYGRLTDEQNQRMRAGYMGCCTHIDYELGRMMEVLGSGRQGENLLNNTLILFTSDHGDMQGDHYLHRKSYAYEGSARIPFLLRYPESLSLPSGIFEQVVGLEDVMPTILDAVGVKIPNSVTGRSVLDAIRDKKWREFIHGEHAPCYSKDNGMHYLTDGKEKYIYFPTTGQEQFFDLRKDYQELYDLTGMLHLQLSYFSRLLL